MLVQGSPCGVKAWRVSPARRERVSAGDGSFARAKPERPRPARPLGSVRGRPARRGGVRPRPRRARLVSAKGSETDGYGRLVLTFDKPITVKASVSGGVLILGYGEKATAGPERLSEEMATYVTAVRRDPDGTGLRLALQRPVRANVQLAGERVFVDLLPESWRGLPPPLPQDVVADLARRARIAEEALQARIPTPPPKPLALELAHLPTLTRFSMRVPEGVPLTLTNEGAATRLRVTGRYAIDAGNVRGRPRPGVSALATDADENSASLILTPAEGFVVTGEREDGIYTLDVTRKAPPAPPKSTEGRGARRTRASGSSSKGNAAQGGGKRGEGRPVAKDTAPKSDTVPTRPAGSGLVFPFAHLPPAALFERGGIAFLAFETADPVAVPPPGATGLRSLGEPKRFGPYAPALRPAGGQAPRPRRRGDTKRPGLGTLGG